MPGCAVHFEIARRVMERWELHAMDAPFSRIDPGARSAFFLGSLGPDLGYLPGADPLLADLAHCVRTADLARKLIASATTGAERAFAWGWATHVLADIWIHPLINQAVGALVEGRQPGAVSFAHDRAAHIRVETGLDAALPAIGIRARPSRIGLKTAIDAAALVATAYQAIYGFSPSVQRLRATLPWAWTFGSLALLNGAVVSGRPSGRFGRGSIRLTAGLARLVRSGGLLAAFTNPVQPPDWLVENTRALIAEFPDRFRPYWSTNLAGLPNINLDTGQLEQDSSEYPVTRSALAELARRNGRKGS